MNGHTFSLFKSMNEGLNPDNPSPTGFIKRVVQGDVIYPLVKES